MTSGSASHPRFPHLLSPIQIGPKRLRCRVLVTAHEIRLGDGRVPGARYAAYHRARARGGAGLQITGCTAIHHTGGLGSGGALANVDEIAEIVGAFGAAADRCRKGGMDGVEILAAFGFLVAAFLSPVANRRTDDYGGSLENRMRFCREVVSAVRDAVGPDGIVGLRIPGDELVEGGLEIEEMKAVARAIESDREVDYLNVTEGTGESSDPKLSGTRTPSTPDPESPSQCRSVRE